MSPSPTAYAYCRFTRLQELSALLLGTAQTLGQSHVQVSAEDVGLRIFVVVFHP